MKKIVILGSTGSIGAQTLDIIRANPRDFCVIGLSAHKNTDLFEKQIREFGPKYIVQTSASENPEKALCALASAQEADLIVNALAGYSGLMPTYAACKAGKKIALANKESMVMAGELLMETAEKMRAEIIPIDSELSAVWQMIENPRTENPRNRIEAVEKIILTASGGPFWKWRREELSRVSVSQALKHPTWKMGEKISIDSATLMNKAFEIMGTRWLFGVAPEKIDVTIHRQSIIHSLVQFKDGNTHAVLSSADMKIPISWALYHPDRASNTLPRLDINELQLTFEKPDYSILEGPKLAYESLKAGGIMPAALCIADEIAVQKFLRGEIQFLEIYDYIHRMLDRAKNAIASIEEIVNLKAKMMHNGE